MSPIKKFLFDVTLQNGDRLSVVSIVAVDMQEAIKKGMSISTPESVATKVEIIRTIDLE